MGAHLDSGCPEWASLLEEGAECHCSLKSKLQHASLSLPERKAPPRMVRPKPEGPEGQRQAWGQGSEPGYISHRARERGCCRWRGCENTALGWGSGQSPRLLSTPRPGWVTEKTNPWRKAPWRSLRPLHRPVASLGRGGGVAAMEGTTPIAPLPPPAASDLRVRRTPGVCFPALSTKLNNLA